MNHLLAIIAGLLQGLTEFLPISSTGHLIIFENFFGISQNEFGLAFDASLHLGTLLAIVTYFLNDYLKVFDLKNKLLLKLIIGSIPATIIGLLLESFISGIFRQNWIVAASLILFSPVMFFVEKKGKKERQFESISPKESFIIGVFQSLALIPGISRSGATISAGLFLGLKRQDAASFSFFLAGPIIAAAGAKKLLDVVTSNSFQSGNLDFFIIGIISSGIFGYLTIKYFLIFLSTKTIVPFVIYRVALGLILLLVEFTILR